MENELEKCECGHDVPLKFAVYDKDGIPTCMPCYIEHLQDVIKNKNKVIKSLRNKNLQIYSHATQI